MLWSGEHVFEGTVETLEMLRSQGEIGFQHYSVCLLPCFSSEKASRQTIVVRHK